MIDPKKQAAKPEPTAEQAILERLNALGQALTRTRTEAVTARAASGIEDVWREDEEHYEGIDDLNRGEKSSWQSKPPGQAFPRTPVNQSTEFVNITRPYVDAAASKVGDILLPTDERSWGLSETPIPELIDKANGVLPPEVVDGMAQAGVPDDKAAQVAQIEAQQATKTLAEARATAKKAEKRIEDWHVEGQWHAEMRKLIDDCCRIGSGVLKGPVPVNKRSQAYKDGKLVIQDEIKPVSKRINPWNFFPDGACGESIHRGSYTWERDFITPRMLEEMKRDPDYVGSQIDLCLAEGPQKTASTTKRKTADGKELDDKTLFEIWYFHGQATRQDLEVAGCQCPAGEQASVPAMFTLVNDRVIKGALNPLDTGEFPYDVMPWQRRANMPWGSGVGRQIRTPQRIVVAGVRTMLTNAGRAAGPIFIIKNGVITAADGSMEITPWKIFYAGEDETTDDVAKAMAMLQIPIMQQELMNIVEFGLKMAEDVTGLPLLLQGQAGSAPETLGGQQLVDRNASGVLRRIARTFDDCITEPHVRRYYAWLLQYGEDDEKGEFVIDARGSIDLVERDIYKQEVQALLQASLNPAFGLDPVKTMAEHLRTTKKKPEDFQLSDDQKKQLANQKPPAAPAVEAAQIREEGATHRKEMELQAQAAEKEKDRQLGEVALQVSERLADIKAGSAKEMTIEEIKGMLAKVVMELNVQKDLSLAGHKVDLHKHSTTLALKPPTEPAGRAPNGQSFQA